VCRIYAEHPNKHSNIKYKLLPTNQKHPQTSTNKPKTTSAEAPETNKN